MKTSSHRRRLERIERQRVAPQSLEPIAGIGLSALLASCPDPKPDRRDMTTPDEAQWMRQHRDQIEAAVPWRDSRSLADMLAFNRERIAAARRLLAAETV